MIPQPSITIVDRQNEPSPFQEDIQFSCIKCMV
uniref:Uncharacterized protein n=1 Tax=Rhizophora mucronata TaxID=61149 RepID=A0A2P2QV91_RHIMU